MQPIFASAMKPELLVAIASAVMQAVETWRLLRDRHAMARVAAEEYARAQQDPEVLEEAEEVQSLIPLELLGVMVGRADLCFKRYQVVLTSEGEFLPSEIDEGNDAVIACVCRELKRLYKLNRAIPPGRLRRFWETHCSGEEEDT